MKLFILGIFLTSFAHAWTLNNNFGASFKSNNVKVYVDSGTTCANNMITINELESLIAPAVDNFWNKVPTSNLHLDSAGFSEPVATMNHGRLCSPTDEDCIAAATAAGGIDPTKGLIPAVDNIVIACNDNNLNFGGGNVLAVTIPNKFSGKKIKGAVILINETSSTFGSLSQSDKIAVIAHEIGHAIGLGHSEQSEAMMYYRTVNLRKRLGQDDVDGVSFLYPIKGDLFGLSKDGLGGNCGTIDTDKKTPPGNPPFLQMGIAMGALVLMFELLRLLKRSKARSAA